MRPKLHVPACLILALGACSEERAPTPLPLSTPMRPGSGAAATRHADAPDGAVAIAGATKVDEGPPPYEGPYIGATVFQALVMSETEWPAVEGKKSTSSSVRIGYLRHGGKAAVIPEPHRKNNCPEGWYELVAGGYVCARYATLDLNHPKFKQAHAPDLAAALPYSYAVNNVHGTPLYRQVPSHEERLKYEPWLV